MVPGRGAAPGAYLGAAGNRPPLRLDHGQGAGHIPRAPHKVRLVPRAPLPAAARGRGAPNVVGRPPGPRSARPGHRPQPAPSFLKAPRPASGTGFFRHPVPAAPALRLLRTTSARASPSLPPL